MSKESNENLAFTSDVKSSFRTRIAAVIDAHKQDDIYGDRTEDCCCGNDRDGTETWSDHLALVLTDLLIDMAGQGELLKAIDRMRRD